MYQIKHGSKHFPWTLSLTPHSNQKIDIVISTLEQKLAHSGDGLLAPKFNVNNSFKCFFFFFITVPASNSYREWSRSLIPDTWQRKYKCSFLDSFGLNSRGQGLWFTQSYIVTSGWIAISDKENLHELSTSIFQKHKIIIQHFPHILLFTLPAVCNIFHSMCHTCLVAE